MARWRLFGRTKEKDSTESDDILQEAEVEPITEEKEDEPLAQYSETLETGTSKKSAGHGSSNKSVWRNVDLIEEKVDNLHITRAKKPVTALDKTVDKLIYKKKKK